MDGPMCTTRLLRPSARTFGIPCCGILACTTPWRPGEAPTWGGRSLPPGGSWLPAPRFLQVHQERDQVHELVFGEPAFEPFGHGTHRVLFLLVDIGPGNLLLLAVAIRQRERC